MSAMIGTMAIGVGLAAMVAAALPGPVVPPPAAVSDEPIEMAPISADSARRRLAAVAASEAPTAEDLRMLMAISERVQDPSLRALAAYNAGTLAAAMGDDRAVGLLERADRTAGLPSLRAAARFNLGHAAMPAADAPEDTVEAIDASITALRRSAELFRSVLDLEPGHAEAAGNTERVRRRIRELREKRDAIEAREEAMRELAEQLEQLAEQQEQEAGESKSQAEQGQSPGESAGERQQSLNERTEAAEQAAQSGGMDGEGAEAIRQAREAQERAQKAIKADDTGAAAEAQEEAAEALQRAAEKAREGAGKDEPGEGGEGEGSEGEPAEDPAPAPTNGSDGEGSDEATGAQQGPQIDPLAEALLDKERREREQRTRYIQRGGRQQVERDW